MRAFSAAIMRLSSEGGRVDIGVDAADLDHDEQHRTLGEPAVHVDTRRGAIREGARLERQFVHAGVHAGNRLMWTKLGKSLFSRGLMVGGTGIEPVTPAV